MPAPPAISSDEEDPSEDEELELMEEPSEEDPDEDLDDAPTSPSEATSGVDSEGDY